MVVLEYVEFCLVLCVGVICKLWEKNDLMGFFIRICYNNSLEVKRYFFWNNWWIMYLCFGYNDLINIVGKVYFKVKRFLE